jgi:HK97 family phage prohead protease
MRIINRVFLPFEVKDIGVDSEHLDFVGEIEWKLADPQADPDADKNAHPLDCKISGYAAVFNNVDNGGDIILPGAFKKSLAEWQKRKEMPPILWQHMQSVPIGMWDEMAEDAKGLKVSGTLFGDVPQGVVAATLLKRKAIKGLSIGFKTIDADRDLKTYVRSIKQAEIYEASPVTFPMNVKAGVTQVKNDFLFPSDRELEKALRDAGLSKNDAKAAVAVTKKMVSRDGETAEQPRREGAGELLISLRRASSLFN